MPRHPRISPDGFVQHVLNRGDHRETLFHKPTDFRAFLLLLADAALRVPIRILAYCIMRNHFHLVVWPFSGDDLPVFMQTLMNLHIARYLKHYPPASPGHLYQGRYTNSLVQGDQHLFRLIRYVEANPRSAGIVGRAQDYEWSSASPHAVDPGRPEIAQWPVPKPADWLAFVNARAPANETSEIRRTARRGAPFGAPEWTTAVVEQYGLEHTLRPRGRPRIYEKVSTGDADAGVS